MLLVLPRHSAPDYSICLSDSTAHLILSHRSEFRCWKAATTQTRHASSCVMTHALQHYNVQNLRSGWRREVGCEMFPKPCLQAAYSACQQLCSALQGTRMSPTREPDKNQHQNKRPSLSTAASASAPLRSAGPDYKAQRCRGTGCTCSVEG